MIGLWSDKITKDILGYMSWYFQLSNNVKDLRASPKSTSFKVKPFLSNKVTNIPTRYSLPIFIAVQLCGTYFRKECSLVWCQGGQYFSHADTQQLGSGKPSTKSKQGTLLLCLQESYKPSKICPTKPATSLSVKSCVEGKFKKFHLF